MVVLPVTGGPVHPNLVTDVGRRVGGHVDSVCELLPATYDTSGYLFPCYGVANEVIKACLGRLYKAHFPRVSVHPACKQPHYYLESYPTLYSINMASPQVPSGSFDEDHDPPIYRALNPTTGQAKAPRAPVTNTMDAFIPPTPEQATAPTPLAPLPPPPKHTLSLFQEYGYAIDQGPSHGHENPSTAAAQDECAKDTPASHQPAEDKMAPSPPPAPHKLIGKSGAPESLFDLAIESVQSSGDAPVTMDQAKVMIQESIREAMGSGRRLGESLWDSFAGPHALPSPSHRPTPPSSPVERRQSLGKALPRPADGSPNKSMHDSIPVRAPFSASYTMDGPCTPKPVGGNTASYLSQKLVNALEQVAKGMQDTLAARNKGKGVSNGEPGGSKAAPASILEYKHVDEVYV